MGLVPCGENTANKGEVKQENLTEILSIRLVFGQNGHFCSVSRESSDPVKSTSHTAKFFQLLMLVIFCLAIGEVLATYVTALIFNKTYTELIISLSDPKEVHRELFVTLASLSSVLRFVIVPCGYLWLTDRSSIQNLHPASRFDTKAAMLVVMLFLSALPIIPY